MRASPRGLRGITRTGIRKWKPACSVWSMPEKSTIRRARDDARKGKAPSTQAGEFVREEIEHIREGKHGARSAKQAIAIGLSKARRAGVKLPASKSAGISPKKRPAHKSSPARSRKALSALRREPHTAASHAALSRQTRRSSRNRGAAARQAAARKAARTRARNK